MEFIKTERRRSLVKFIFVQIFYFQMTAKIAKQKTDDRKFNGVMQARNPIFKIGFRFFYLTCSCRFFIYSFRLVNYLIKFILKYLWDNSFILKKLYLTIHKQYTDNGNPVRASK